MVHSYLFDGDFLQPSGGALSFNFSRSWGTGGAIRDPGGVASPNDTRRYWHHPRLLCSAPEVINEFDISGGQIAIYAGGFDKDGVTRLTVTKYSLSSKITIHSGDLGDGTSMGTTLYSRDIIGGLGTSHEGVENILADTDEDYEEEIVHGPTAFCVCHGLVVAICEVREDLGSGTGGARWRPIGTSICYWQGGGWTLAATFSPHQAAKPRGASFQIQDFRVLGTEEGEVRKAFFTLANYVVNESHWPTNIDTHFSDGGQVYMFTAERSSALADWVVQEPTIILELPEIFGTPGYHIHAAYVERWKASWLRVVVAVGDTWPRSRVIALYREDENYAEGPASPTDSGTGSPTNGWITRDNRHGTHGNGPEPVADGNQFIGACPLGPLSEPRGQLIGGDESFVAIMKTSHPTRETTLIG